MSDVRVVFNADNGQFVASVDGMTKAVAKQSEAVATAKNMILESTKQQIQAATEAGASVSSLERIYKKSAENMANVSESTANKIINGFKRISEQNRKVAMEMNALNSAVPRSAPNMSTGSSGHDTSDRMAASAVVRTLDNGAPGIRSIENFLITIPGVGAAMQALFPIIGAAGLAGLLFDMGEKGVEAFEKVKHAGEAIAGDFKILTGQLIDVNLAMDITSDKLEDEIAKLSKKPGNGLQTGLDEGTQAAKRLADMLDKDLDKIKEVTKERAVGFFGGLVTDTGETKGASDLVTKGKAQIDAVRHEYDDVVSRARQGGNVANINQAETARLVALQVVYAKVDASLKAAKDAADSANNFRNSTSSAFGSSGVFTGSGLSFDSGRNNAPSSAILGGGRAVLDQEQHLIGGDFRRGNDQAEKGQLTDAKRAQELATKAAEEALKAQKEQWQKEDDSIKTAGGQTSALEAWMWQDRINNLKKGSAGYKEQLDFAQHQLAGATKETQTQDAEAAKRGNTLQAKQQGDQFSFQRDVFSTSGKRTPQQMADLAGIQMLEALPENLKAATDKWKEAQGAADKYADEALKASNRSTIAAVQQKANADLASIALQVQTGQISRQSAALQTANIHAEQYRQTQEALRKALDDAGDPKGAGAINAQAAITKAAADRSVQSMQDAANTAATTWQGALKNANASWVQDAQDSAKQVTDLFEQAMSGLNDNLSDLMVGKKANFAGMFQSLGKSMSTDALKHLEAPVLGALGMGKADGSSANPFSVKIVDGLGGDGVGAFGAAASKGLHGLFDKSDDSDSSDSGGSGVGGFFSTLASAFIPGFGGHKALGGDVQAGVTYDVGEMGREEFTPSTNGTITPHNKMGNGPLIGTIDARGSNDPAQTEAAIHRAMSAYAPHIANATMKASTEQRKRSPGTAH